MAASLVWLGLAFILGLRKWGCTLPWSRECTLVFFGHLETMVLFMWVKDWETLAAGLLAVAAAGVSVIYLRRQIAQSQEQENRRLRRQHRAAKAVMPDALSELCAFATESALRYHDCLAAFHEDRRPDMERLSGTEAPLLPQATIVTFQAMIAASPRSVAEPFIRLLADLQVHQTRWQGFENSVRGQSRRRITSYVRYNLMGEICEAAELYANATDLFSIVRPFDPAEPAPQARCTLRSSLLLMGLMGELELMDLAQEREAKRSLSTVPGIAPLPSPTNH